MVSIKEIRLWRPRIQFEKFNLQDVPVHAVNMYNSNTYSHSTIYYFITFMLLLFFNQNFIFQIKKDDSGYLEPNQLIVIKCKK